MATALLVIDCQMEFARRRAAGIPHSTLADFATLISTHHLAGLLAKA